MNNSTRTKNNHKGVHHCHSKHYQPPLKVFLPSPSIFCQHTFLHFPSISASASATESSIIFYPAGTGLFNLVLSIKHEHFHLSHLTASSTCVPLSQPFSSSPPLCWLTCNSTTHRPLAQPTTLTVLILPMTSSSFLTVAAARLFHSHVVAISNS